MNEIIKFCINNQIGFFSSVEYHYQFDAHGAQQTQPEHWYTNISMKLYLKPFRFNLRWRPTETHGDYIRVTVEMLNIYAN